MTSQSEKQITAIHMHVEYLKKSRQSGNQIWSVNRI